MAKVVLMIDTTIKSLDMKELATVTGNVYKTVAILGMRAAQISKAIKIELNDKLAQFGPVGESLEEIVENREQIEIAKYYEAIPKPSLQSIDEFKRGKTFYKDISEL